MYIPVWDKRYRYNKSGDGDDPEAKNGYGYWFINDFQKISVCAY